MFKNLMELFAPPEDNHDAPITTELAVAALLVHLAGIDGEFADVEMTRIRQVLRNHFSLDEDAVSQAEKFEALAAKLEKRADQLEVRAARLTK